MGFLGKYMALSKWHLSTASNISRSEISGLVPVLVDVSGISCRHAEGQGMEKGMTPANMSTSSRTPLGTPQRLLDGSRTPDCRKQHVEWLYTGDCRQDWKSSQKLVPNLTDKTKYVCYHRTLVPLRNYSLTHWHTSQITCNGLPPVPPVRDPWYALCGQRWARWSDRLMLSSRSGTLAVSCFLRRMAAGSARR